MICIRVQSISCMLVTARITKQMAKFAARVSKMQASIARSKQKLQQMLQLNQSEYLAQFITAGLHSKLLSLGGQVTLQHNHAMADIIVLTTPQQNRDSSNLYILTFTKLTTHPHSIIFVLHKPKVSCCKWWLGFSRGPCYRLMNTVLNSSSDAASHRKLQNRWLASLTAQGQ